MLHICLPGVRFGFHSARRKRRAVSRAANDIEIFDPRGIEIERQIGVLGFMNISSYAQGSMSTSSSDSEGVMCLRGS